MATIEQQLHDLNSDFGTWSIFLSDKNIDILKDSLSDTFISLGVTSVNLSNNPDEETVIKEFKKYTFLKVLKVCSYETVRSMVLSKFNEINNLLKGGWVKKSKDGSNKIKIQKGTELYREQLDEKNFEIIIERAIYIQLGEMLKSTSVPGEFKDVNHLINTLFHKYRKDDLCPKLEFDNEEKRQVKIHQEILNERRKVAAESAYMENAPKIDCSNLRVDKDISDMILEDENNPEIDIIPPEMIDILENKRDKLYYVLKKEPLAVSIEERMLNLADVLNLKGQINNNIAVWFTLFKVGKNREMKNLVASSFQSKRENLQKRFYEQLFFE